MNEELLEEKRTDSVSDTEIICEENEKEERKKNSLWVMLCVIVVAVVAIGALAVIALRTFGIINPYEKDYIDVTGRTAADIAKDKSYKYEKFLKEYGLPEDMPKNTSERAVYYNIPVRKYVEKTPGTDSFEQLKAEMGWDDSVTEDMTMGEALDITKLKYYVGEEQLERFKALYELPDEVNGETLYGEVRNLVDAKEKEFYLAEQVAAEEEAAEEENSGEVSNTVVK